MTAYRIVPARIEHVDELMPALRKADRIEVEIASGEEARDAIKASVRMSYEAIAAYADGRLVMLAGVVPYNFTAFRARPWLVGADELPRHAYKLCKENRRYVKKWLQWFPYLENYVDAENTVAHRWLKWLGFELEEPAPWKNSGHLFIRFHQGAY